MASSVKKHIVDRTCSTVSETEVPHKHDLEAKAFKDYRKSDAYVLLGPPGAGKSTTFKQESRETEGGHYLSARDFCALEQWDEWKEKTLFIDGLDEVRCGTHDKRAPFDRIRANLVKLGNPRFRLSCREADWFGLNDTKHIQKVARNGRIDVLRINPLTEDDVREILHHHSTDIDPDDFLERAKTAGLFELLLNPQSLEMLIKEVGKGSSWPTNRTGTFDLACKTLVTEHNEEHRLGTPTSSLSEEINTAGRLCAVLLLSGNHGYTRQPNESDGLIPINRVAVEGESEKCDRVLGSKLFESAQLDTFEPVHRHVAEFLAGKYLSSKTICEIPLGRVLALGEYDDGFIVPEVRGLFAWLSAWCPGARREIISRDPIGTVLYGDIENFSLVEKAQILDGIRSIPYENRQILSTFARDSRAGELATEETVQLFQDALSKPTPDEHFQWFAGCLVSLLRHGTVHPNLFGTLWNFVRNSQWHPDIRVAALELLLDESIEHPISSRKFKGLLQEIQNGTVEDPEDELRGHLLDRLYGNGLSLSEALDFLEEPKAPNFRGGYQNFWIDLDFTKASIDEVAQSLDTIENMLDEYQAPEAKQSLAFKLRPKLFLRFLSNFVDRAGVERIDRLIRWLDTARKMQVPRSSATNLLKSSLKKRADLVQAVITGIVDDSLSKPNFELQMQRVDLLLLNLNYQSELSDWLLDQACEANDPRAATWFIRKTAGALYSSDANYERMARVTNRLEGNPQLLGAFNNRIHELESFNRQQKEYARNFEERNRARQHNWRQTIEDESDSIRDNRTRLGLLSHLAHVYFGEVLDVEGDSPNERLQNLLGGKYQELVERILEGLRNAIRRDDVPDSDTILQLRGEKKVHVLGLPILAGLQEEGDSSKLLGNESHLRTALAIYFSMRLPQLAQRTPHWLLKVLDSASQTVAKILIEAIRVRWKTGDDCREIFYELGYSPEFATVASLGAFPLLETFPVRCSNRQLVGLACLLRAASIHHEDDKLPDIVQAKLEKKGMNAGQRVYWLATGLLLEPEKYRASFQSYVGTSEQKVAHLIQFLSEQDSSASWTDTLEVSTVGLLIRVIGRKCRPVFLDFGSDIYSSDSAKGSKCISTLLDHLSQDPSDNAMRCLENLINEFDLSSWHDRLRQTLQRQRNVRRESKFKHAEPQSVIDTLANREPANIGDLKSLTLEALDRIGRTLRDGNTSGWRKFWNVNSRGQVEEPRPEMDCRNRLVEDLLPFLEHRKISVESELLYADYKKCDITLVGDAFKLPIELKLSHSPDLFSAIEEQLVAKYTRDPVCDGHGIYIVLWFGKTEHRTPTKQPNKARRPATAHELEKELHQSLDPDHNQKIAIRVVDVSEQRVGKSESKSA